jgi:hypothetical protein
MRERATKVVKRFCEVPTVSALPSTKVPPALPVSCLMLSGLCGWLARRVHVQPLMKEIQAQIALDIQTLRQVKVT